MTEYTLAQRYIVAVEDLEVSAASGPEELRASIANVRRAAAEAGITSAWPCRCGRILAVARPCPACGSIPTQPAYLTDLLANLEAMLEAGPGAGLGSFYFRPGAADRPR